MYVFGTSGSIWAQAGTGGGWNLAYSDENGQIKGASEWQFDDDKNYMFWATDTSIARRKMSSGGAIPWDNATQDHKVEGIDPVDWHTMKPASGVLMIANGENLATYNFAQEFNAAQLNIFLEKYFLN